MPGKQLKDYLNQNKIKYISITHPPAFTSQEVAASAHISGKELAKIVMAKSDGKLVMVVVPAHEHVNFGALKKLTGQALDLASEADFKDKFPECEIGTMPPFGGLYNMPVYVASDLTKQQNITFNAGSHSELMQLTYEDFEKLVKPQIFLIH